jgi:hypothetical protein
MPPIKTARPGLPPPSLYQPYGIIEVYPPLFGKHKPGGGIIFKKHQIQRVKSNKKKFVKNFVCNFCNSAMTEVYKSVPIRAK